MEIVGDSEAQGNQDLTRRTCSVCTSCIVNYLAASGRQVANIGLLHVDNDCLSVTYGDVEVDGMDDRQHWEKKKKLIS